MANKVVIPMSARVQKILVTHDDKFPNDLLDIIFEFNKALRNICRKAEINKTIHISKNIAGTRSVKQYKKFELVSSHTARRTFCTNKYLAGMPSDGIMQFSGHKTERSFRKYLKMEAEENAIKFTGFF